MSISATLAASLLAVTLTLGGAGTAANASTGPLPAFAPSATMVEVGSVAQAQATGPATVPSSINTSSAGVSSIKPRSGWGSVIKILSSKPTCIAARDFYNTLPFPKVKCVKRGKVWVVIPR